jgi:hypothetical protein
MEPLVAMSQSVAFCVAKRERDPSLINCDDSFSGLQTGILIPCSLRARTYKSIILSYPLKTSQAWSGLSP